MRRGSLIHLPFPAQYFSDIALLLRSENLQYLHRQKTNMKNLSFVLLLAFLPLLSVAQEFETFTTDQIKEAYESSTMIPFNTSFEINKKRIPFGLFRKNLRRELKKSDDAWLFYKEYRKKSWTGFGFMVGAVPLGIVSGVLTLNLAIGYSTFFVPYSGGVVFLVQASQFYKRSIWAYNRDMMLQKLDSSLKK